MERIGNQVGRRCRSCGQNGHNIRTCPIDTQARRDYLRNQQQQQEQEEEDNILFQDQYPLFMDLVMDMEVNNTEPSPLSRTTPSTPYTLFTRSPRRR